MTTILFLAANPTDATRLALGCEVREVSQRLRGTPEGRSIKLAQEWAVRPEDVQEHLLRHKASIVHFSGHGTRTGQLLFEDASGNAAPISKQAIASLFRALKGQTRCVVLNACYSAEQAKGIAEHIDCVVGMNTAVKDTAAIAFAFAFYRALGFGQSMLKAFELGRNQLELSGYAGVDIPQIMVREGVNPDDVRLGEAAL